MSNYKTHFDQAYAAKRSLLSLTDESVNTVLLAIADMLTKQSSLILIENQKDLHKMDVSDAKYDRLQLTQERILGIAEEIKSITQLPNPIGKVISQKTMPNLMEIKKVSVPLGVVGIIYEARPNVTVDVFSLCFKTGNVVLLKGGSDAERSNIAIVKLIQKVLEKYSVDPNVITLLPVERESTDALLNAVDVVDVIIPRGSKGLINFVREHSKVPVIETGAGIVHVFVDETANVTTAADIVFNSKTRRPSVCNSLDCLIVHEALLPKLPEILAPLVAKEVLVYADQQAYEAVVGSYPDGLLEKAQPEHYGTEFLSLKMAVKTVTSLEEALLHIEKNSSKHSEAIVSKNDLNIARFLNAVDAAAVYANVSTAFTDGAQFGLGAEIGISTQKLHARGPMGLEELTSYKWVVNGHGQIRN